MNGTASNILSRCPTVSPIAMDCDFFPSFYFSIAPGLIQPIFELYIAFAGFSLHTTFSSSMLSESDLAIEVPLHTVNSFQGFIGLEQIGGRLGYKHNRSESILQLCHHI